MPAPSKVFYWSLSTSQESGVPQHRPCEENYYITVPATYKSTVFVFWSTFLELQVIKLGDMIDKTFTMTYMAGKQCMLLYTLYCEGSFDAYSTKVRLHLSLQKFIRPFIISLGKWVWLGTCTDPPSQ
jgi:hypothetical protein